MEDEFSSEGPMRCSANIHAALVQALNAEKKSRELSLVITKLDEALMWLDRIPEDDRP